MSAAPFAVAVVGSGPAGFYLAEALLRAGVQVDMFERLPTPFGLVRFGVAPDHPKLKLVTLAFERIAATPGFEFFGGVEVGRDVGIEALLEAYDAVGMATGAALDRRLGVPGEQLAGVHPAGDFVAWYNGHPDFAGLEFDLRHEAAVIVGHGNVALDVARILAKPVDALRRTDITERALQTLAESRIREIHVVGRGRGADAKFGAKDLREFADLGGCDALVNPRDLGQDQVPPRDAEALEKAALLQDFSRTRPEQNRSCTFHFGLSPVAVEGRGRVETIAFQRASSHDVERIACGLVLSSIGRRTAAVPGVPYDETRGVHANDGGRVGARLYVSGWSKRGAIGTIGTNRACAGATAEAMLADFSGPARGRDDRDALIARLDAGSRRLVRHQDWKRLDAAEILRGAALGKPREKIVALSQARLAIEAGRRSVAGELSSQAIAG